MSLPPVLFAAGGTGGHLYPALAIAEQLRRNLPDLPIAFAGTPDHLEATVVPREGFPFHPIRVIGLPRRPGPDMIRFGLLMSRAVAQARALLQSLRPAVVVGCGAYVSVPAIAAARLLGIPTLLAEANAYPGLANRVLGRLATRVAVAIPGTEGNFPAGKAVCLGNPIRAAFGMGDRAEARRSLGFPPTERMVLITGGSLGAQSLNAAVGGVLEAVLALPEWSVLHVAGPKNLQDVVAATGAQPAAPGGGPASGQGGGAGDAYEAHGGRYRLLGYCDRMPEAILAADLLVSRSGATIVAEITAAGRPGILVPLGINPDQAANARFLEQAGAAVVVRNDSVQEDLGAALMPLLADPGRLETMGQAARTLGRPNAAGDIADLVLQLAGLPVREDVLSEAGERARFPW